MEKYNIIPMGDNCIVAEVIRDLNLRKCSLIGLVTLIISQPRT